MNVKIIAVIAIAATSLGCANISPLNPTSIFPTVGDGSVTVTGSQSNQVNLRETKASKHSVHLDASQRLLFFKKGMICAEPSPDALQAYASSLGFGLTAPQPATAEGVQALSTSSGSIGLRTQSINLVRDYLYRVCEAAASGSISEVDVAQILRRLQDMTLGILAIEQLTASTNENAVELANLAAIQESLDEARETERLANEAFSEAELYSCIYGESAGTESETTRSGAESTVPRHGSRSHKLPDR